MNFTTQSEMESARRESKPQVVLSGGNIAHYHHAALALQNAGQLKKYFCVFTGEGDLGILRLFLSSRMKRRLSAKALPDLDRRWMDPIAWPYLTTRFLLQSGWFSQQQAAARFNEWYDNVTRRRLPPCDIFHFVNGVGLATIRRAHDLGYLTICDIRAEHVDTQEQLLQEEHYQLGLPYQSMRALYRERLLAEYEMADALIFHSQYVADTFRQQGIASEKIHIVPYGVDLSRFGGQLANDAAVAAHEQNLFRIIFVGNVIPLKGLHYLIEAFQTLALSDSELLVVGVIDSEYKGYLDRMFSQARIRFLGRIPQVDLWRYYGQSSVFVLPSLSDSFGHVVAEAMVAGLPVIVSENTGAKEMVREGIDGFIVPIRNVTALQEKLQWLYDHPQERKMMGQQAAQQAKQYTWEKYGQQLLLVYEHILSQKRAK
ncbi:MAG: glycosyltransferase family 4 protein [Chloroflexi bacterium]|nr:glycosyltransferase family 4 protein [Chloroflexota bacterium]